MEDTAIDLGSRYLDARVGDGVLRVRINRPERRNATTQDMYRGLKRAAIIADSAAEIDVLCLTGTDRWFGSGGDMSGEAEDPAGWRASLTRRITSRSATWSGAARPSSPPSTASVTPVD